MFDADHRTGQGTVLWALGTARDMLRGARYQGPIVTVDTANQVSPFCSCAVWARGQHANAACRSRVTRSCAARPITALSTVTPFSTPLRTGGTLVRGLSIGSMRLRRLLEARRP